jgi:predicted transcriptional regulator
LDTTSLEAFEGAQEFIGAHHERILSVLGRPMAAEEISTASGIEKHAVGRRMSELVRAGRVERLPETRKNSKGRREHLYGVVNGA